MQTTWRSQAAVWRRVITAALNEPTTFEHFIRRQEMRAHTHRQGMANVSDRYAESALATLALWQRRLTLLIEYAFGFYAGFINLLRASA